MCVIEDRSECRFTSDDGFLRSVLAQALFETSKVVFFRRFIETGQ